jgi:hypothetical protein
MFVRCQLRLQYCGCNGVLRVATAHAGSPSNARDSNPRTHPAHVSSFGQVQYTRGIHGKARILPGHANVPDGPTARPSERAPDRPPDQATDYQDESSSVSFPLEWWYAQATGLSSVEHRFVHLRENVSGDADEPLSVLGVVLAMCISSTRAAPVISTGPSTHKRDPRGRLAGGFRSSASSHRYMCTDRALRPSPRCCVRL